MALKGHTRIELTNVETGEVEVHEDNNMVTNALSKLLGNYGCFCNNPLAEVVNGTPTDTVMKLTGGLMLFDTAIEENPEIINAPAGVSVVGCGSADAYNGENTMAGSYNMTESGWTEDGGYKHVWDFSTSQANGNIACASLTTNAGGKITEGTYPFAPDYFFNVGSNKLNEILFTKNDISTQMNFYNTVKTAGYIMFADGINNRVLVPSTMEEVAYGYYTSTSSTAYENFKKTIFYKKSIDISFYRFGFTNVSIFDGKKEYTQEENNGVYLGSVTVEMPDGLKSIFTQQLLDSARYYWSVQYLSDENNIYLVLRYAYNNTGGVMKPNDTIYIWEINAETFESTYYSIMNLSDEDFNLLSLNHGFSNLSRYMLIGGDYLQFYGATTKKIYSVNKNTNETIIAKTPDGEDFVPYSCGPGYFYNNKFIFDLSITSSRCLGVFDTVSKHILFKNVTLNSFQGEGLSNIDFSDLKKIKGTHYCMGIHSSNSVILYLDPTLLVTINNLETPVQKTSAQTMKVTYVLTQE